MIENDPRVSIEWNGGASAMGGSYYVVRVGDRERTTETMWGARRWARKTLERATPPLAVERARDRYLAGEIDVRHFEAIVEWAVAREDEAR